MKKLIIFIISLLIIIAQESSNNLALNYYHTDAKVYSIVNEKDKFKISIKEVIFCFVEPCIFPILDEKIIDDEEDCKKLQNLFLEIFKDSNENEISVNEKDLNAEQWNIIFNIFEKYNVFSEIKYEIIKNGYYLSQYKERGYYCQKVNDTLIVIVTMGKKPTGGFSINVQKVKIKENSVNIYVIEKVPNPGDIVTEAFTYPSVSIKFNKIIDDIEVLNYETGLKFNRL